MSYVCFLTLRILCLRCSGLIDEGESAEVTALRELKEETGYKGEVVGVTPGIITQRQTIYLIALAASLGCILSPACVRGVQGFHTHFFQIFGTNNEDSSVVVWIAVTCLDPGLSNCTTQIVLVNINGDEMENINPTQQLGEQTDSFILLIHLLLPHSGIHSLAHHILQSITCFLYIEPCSPDGSLLNIHQLIQ